MLLPEPETDTGLMAPAGQLWSTATDLLRFAEVLHGWRDDVLRPDTVSEMQEPASGQAELNAGYGLGVMSLRDGAATMYGHNGSMPGYVAALWVDPDQGLSVTACANSTLAFPTVPMAIDIMRTVADREPKLPPTWQPAAVEPPLLDVTGIWYRGAIPFAVRIVDDCLEMARFGGPAGPVRFCARADGTWVAVTPGYTNGEILQILRDVNGTPTTLDLGSILFARQPYGELSG